MNMSDVMQPKWFLTTKRGVGMVMAGVGALVPAIAGFTGVSIDVATWGQFATSVAQWFDITWNVVAYSLWLYGSFFPTAPLSIKKPV